MSTRAVVEVDLGQAVPIAMEPLRRVLKALEAHQPALVKSVAKTHAPAWNRLFPGTFASVPVLEEIALSPSERRLHRESEQIFQVLNLAAKVVKTTLRETGATLKLTNAGASDLVSLRALMRAAEWSRLEGFALPLQFEGWGARAANGSAGFEARRQRFLTSLRSRTRVAEPTAGTGPTSTTRSPSSEREAGFLEVLLDEGESRERRVAAGLRAIRACFFTTNYEGAMLASERGLAVLGSAPLEEKKIREAWASFGPETSTAAIEMDEDDLGDAEELKGLFHRAAGVVWSYCGENETAHEAFGAGLVLKNSGMQRAHLHMFRALALIKHMGQTAAAREEGYAGVKELAPYSGPCRLVHEAWLRNVLALTWFQDKNLENATGEELIAIKCVSEQHSASATHLRVNLITNLSSVQESAGKLKEAMATWRKFEKMQGAWDTNFHKHHRYRLAALARLAGEATNATGWYEEAYNSAASLDDAFHEQVIACDLGHHHLSQKNAAESADWFEKAAQHAASLGDPYHVAEGRAGVWVARGGDTAGALAAAAADSTWAKECGKLTAALKAGDVAATTKAITQPRTKLNRPFDLVNLY